jgi:hypothetical protein
MYQFGAPRIRGRGPRPEQGQIVESYRLKAIEEAA